MCKVGDIILVRRYKSQGNEISQHSFVVLNIDGGTIQGLPYDIVCNVMSSFQSEEHRKKKLKFKGNIEVYPGETNVEGGNDKRGYIKADQLYYFRKESLDYVVIGNVSVELFVRLIELIGQLDRIEDVTDNL